MATSEMVAPEHLEIHEFLQQWGRWVLSRRVNGHCASIEHRYKSPQCWDERNPRPPEVNERAATLIESLMRIVPKAARKLLKLRYVYRADRDFITKRMRLREFDQALYTARQIVLNLTRHALWPISHGKFNNLSLSGSAEARPLEGALHS